MLKNVNSINKLKLLREREISTPKGQYKFFLNIPCDTDKYKPHIKSKKEVSVYSKGPLPYRLLSKHNKV